MGLGSSLPGTRDENQIIFLILSQCHCVIDISVKRLHIINSVKARVKVISNRLTCMSESLCTLGETWETLLPPSANFLLSCSIPVYTYGSIRIVNPYPHGKKKNLIN